MAPRQPSFDPAREEEELRAYLGEAFERDRLWRYQEQLDAEAAAIKDEQAFYRSSRAYLYNLTAFAMTGTKLPYLRELVALLPTRARVLDYGCGIGSDGLMLLEAGYRVEFADFDNPSTEFLRWRLKRRRLDAPVHDLDQKVPAGFDAAYAFDVAEHVEDPFLLLSELERRADLVEVNFLEPIRDDQPLHHDLPIGPLLAHVAGRRLRRYRLLHRRSHLVAYEPVPASAPRRAASHARVAAGQLRARVALAASSAAALRR